MMLVKKFQIGVSSLFQILLGAVLLGGHQFALAGPGSGMKEKAQAVGGEWLGTAQYVTGALAVGSIMWLGWQIKSGEKTFRDTVPTIAGAALIGAAPTLAGFLTGVNIVL